MHWEYLVMVIILILVIACGVYEGLHKRPPRMNDGNKKQGDANNEQE
jgi:hypothetical protein